jgi:F-type H+-transporting ATPase subunit a
MRSIRFIAVVLVALSPALAHAQGNAAAPTETSKPAAAPAPDFITPHISNSDKLDWPSFSMKDNFTHEYQLPHWAPIHIGPLELDLSPTRHLVMMLLAATIVALLMTLAARSVTRSAAQGKPPTGFANAIEAMVLYVRNEVILPNVGHHGEAFVPFLLTLFFFILTCNLIGLMPWGSTATSNISVTATLAIISFGVVEIAGMRALGAGYIKTLVYWPSDMGLGMKLFISPIMTPVEIIGKITKPLALAIRLFANMIAGHVLVLALISMVFVFGSYWIGLIPAGAAFAIMILELFVAFLQAFVFTLLVSVFVGLVRESAH